MDKFETVWIEVDNKNGTNFLFCCVYRHPSTDIDEFSAYLFAYTSGVIFSLALMAFRSDSYFTIHTC